MIIKEFYKTREDGVNLYKTYSDQSVKIRKVGTGEVYDQAIDVEGAPFEYEETEEKVVTIEEMKAEMEAKRAEAEARRAEALARREAQKAALAEEEATEETSETETEAT